LPTLAALRQAADFNLAAVITNPDRPAGRGLKEAATPVKRWAEANGVKVITTAQLPADAEEGRNLLADYLPMFALVVVASALFIPKWLRENNAAFSLHGAVNLHPSLLPRWRGAAPIQWTLIAGDERAGVSTMALVKELDAGPIYLQKEIAVAPRETAGSLAERLAAAGAELMLATLRRVAREELIPFPQDERGATLAPKITAETQTILWERPAAALDRLIRALHPEPLARAAFRGESVQVVAAEPAAGAGAPGTVLAASA